MGALFLVTTPSSTFVLKVNKAVSKGACAIADVCPYEADLTRFLWDVLAATGASAHVVCPYAVINMKLPRELAFGTSSVNALAMETLTGIRATDGTVLYNLQDLLVAGIRGRVDDFDNVFRTVLFQVLYTVTTWTYLTGGLFRHNDLYARNVGLSTFCDAEASPVDLTYVVHTHPALRSDLFIQRVFSMRTRLRAVVLDFGWSALGTGLGPSYDARFYRQVHDTKGMVVRDLVTTSGMSQKTFSHHYDPTLLMVSLFTITSRAPETGLPSVLREFRDVYKATYGMLHMSDMMHSNELIGRLTNEAQRTLNAGKRLTCTPRRVGVGSAAQPPAQPFTISVPNASELLMLPFFAGFRRAAAEPASLCFGIDMGVLSPHCTSDAESPVTITPTRLAVPPSWNFDTLSPIASTHGGSYNDLLCATRRIQGRYKERHVRRMTPSETAAWTGDSKYRSSTTSDTLKRKRECDPACTVQVHEHQQRRRREHKRKHEHKPGSVHVYELPALKKNGTERRSPCAPQPPRVKYLPRTPETASLAQTAVFCPLTPLPCFMNHRDCIQTVHYVPMTPL